MDTPKPRRKAIDYAGIAALITAISGIVALLVNQTTQAAKTSLVQDSVLAVVQYRLEEIEESIEKLQQDTFDLRLKLARRRGSGISPPLERVQPTETDAGFEMSAGESAPMENADEAVLEQVVQKVRSRRPLKGKELRDLVQQTGKALKSSDLEK